MLQQANAPAAAETLTLGSAYNSRRNNFDFLRFLFASMVVFGHSFTLLYGPGHYDPLERISGRTTDCGSLAVGGFFAISGFLVTQSWERSRGVLDYTRKRYLRIFPGLFVALLVCAFCIPVLLGNGGSFAAAAGWLGRRLPGILTIGIFSDITPPFEFAGTPIRAMNGALWTLPHEFRCYVMVALLGLAGLFRRRVGVLALMVAANWANAAIHGHNPNWFNIGHIYACFITGMAMYLYRDQLPLTRLHVSTAIGSLVLAALIHIPTLIPLGWSYLIFAFAFANRPQLQDWARHADLSYGIYLYHFPIIQMIVLSHRVHSPLILFAAALMTASGIAIFSWRLVEGPILKLKTSPAKMATA